MSDREFEFLIVRVSKAADIDRTAQVIYDNLDDVMEVVPAYFDGFGNFVQDHALHPPIGND